jgi:hypothetical protein
MGMDVEKCIKLYSPILHQPKSQRSWFAAHSLNAASSPNLNIELYHNLTAFLSAIDMVNYP